MICTDCNAQTKKHGTDRKGNQRFRCLACGKTFTEPKAKLLGNMYLAEDKALMCLNLLVEGCSVRSIERITGVHRDTVLSLLETVGKKCLWLQENLVRNVKVKFVQADEIWSFIGMKDKTKKALNITDEKLGTSYTFTSIDSDSKLIVAWHLGRRTEQDAVTFLEKVYQAVDKTIWWQITTDGWTGYDHTVNAILGAKAHVAQLVKVYQGGQKDEQRYSPAECVGCLKKTISGRPVKDKISTSYVERANLTMRMSMRRMTRLTNAFSKKWENMNYSLALHFAHYNFCRSHKTLNGATPAMAANLTKSIWTLKDLLGAATHI
jgi:transposase-like protein/IS1 family transposase